MKESKENINGGKKINEKQIIELTSVIAVIIVLLVMFVFLYWIPFGFKNNSSIEHYNEFAKENEYMPTTTELGKYEKIKVNHYEKRMLVDTYDVYTLNIRYDYETYIKEKQKISEKYIFESSSLKGRNEDKLEPTFIIGSFNFNTLSFATYDLQYTNEMVFIGTSNSKKEISYVYYYDVGGLDYLPKPLSKYLPEDCNWDSI